MSRLPAEAYGITGEQLFVRYPNFLGLMGDGEISAVNLKWDLLQAMDDTNLQNISGIAVYSGKVE